MTIRSPYSRSRLILAMAAAVSVLTLTVAGCSLGESDAGPATSAGQAESGQGGDAPAADSLRDGTDFATGQTSAGDSEQVTSASQIDLGTGSLGGAAMIKTAAVTLETDDVYQVLRQIGDLAVTVGGQVASEETSTDRDGQQVQSWLELQVPVARFDVAFERISGLGTLLAKTRSIEDVTAKVADVESRVTSARESIAQLQRLFARATTLGQVITLERELSRREADLESLQAQQRSLDARTTMSTIAVNVSQTEMSPAATVDRAQGGFVSGIKQGWDGLVTFVVASAHALGLVLPLASLALIVAVVVWYVTRRFRPRLQPAGEPRPSE